MLRHSFGERGHKKERHLQAEKETKEGVEVGERDNRDRDKERETKR